MLRNIRTSGGGGEGEAVKLFSPFVSTKTYHWNKCRMCLLELVCPVCRGGVTKKAWYYPKSWVSFVCTLRAAPGYEKTGKHRPCLVLYRVWTWETLLSFWSQIKFVYCVPSGVSYTLGPIRGHPILFIRGPFKDHPVGRTVNFLCRVRQKMPDSISCFLERTLGWNRRFLLKFDTDFFSDFRFSSFSSNFSQIDMA